MEAVAIYYEGTIVYWSSIIIAAGILAGLFIGLCLYVPRNKYGFGFCIYYPVAVAASVVSARILHWYCYKEQYESLGAALGDFSKGGYLMPAVLVTVWIVSLVFIPFTKKHSRFQILDPLAPALAFVIAVIKYSDIYSDLCLGKLVITDQRFYGLPISIMTPEGDYRLATFFITSMLMLLVTVILIVFFYYDERHTKKKPYKSSGHTWAMFLVLYGVVEIVMDSTRYDAAHFGFPGEALAVLNKGMGFMGFSQLIGAICCLYLFIYYMIMSVKANGWKKLNITALIIFILGLSSGGTAEYLVQRYFGMYKYWYALQITGVIIMAVSVFILYFMGIEGKRTYKKKRNVAKQNAYVSDPENEEKHFEENKTNEEI